MVGQPPLTTRQQTVLRALVHLHVETSAPVGSRVLTQRSRLGLSPATVRNVMATLEKMGLIAPPHTSAGRIPTDTGYRRYVDDLMELPELAPQAQVRINETLTPVSGLLEDRLQSVAALLAELAPYTAIIQLPADETLCLREVHVARLSEAQVIVILVTTAGAMRHRVVDFAAAGDAGVLDRMSRYLTEHLADTPLGEAELTLEVRQPRDGDERELHAACLTVARQLLRPADDARVLLDGTRKLIEQPEFQDQARARDLLRLLEAKTVLNRWLAQDVVLSNMAGPVHFCIGAENTAEGAQGCALASVPYRIGSATGRLALLGPKRMQYRETAALLAFTARRLTAAYVSAA